jgi:dipeptidyl aminopeptidase/acylaminoacyl peptidase
MGTFSADGWRLACVRSTPTQPGEVHVLEVERSVFASRKVTGFNDALLAELDLAEPRERWVKAKDGHRVQCWSMRPRAARGRIPAILEIHGGPHAQYGLTFFHEFQLLCAQGYEVWFPNPRGSKGYGERHTAAIRGAWGTKDWMDVQAVAAAMRRDPGIRRDRIGIMGGSYGGYMTNWAVAHDRGFRAAITDRCVSNMVSMAGNSDLVDFPGAEWKGGPFTDPRALWQASPIAHFAKVRTPMLVIHSEGDLRCNVEQGEQVFTALCTLGVPARFVRYPRESSHGMSRAGPPDLRIHRLREILAWWARWMK